MGREKTMASLTVVMGPEPAQNKSVMTLMHDEDGGVCKKLVQSTWKYINGDAEMEIEDGMRRLHIYGWA
jgi:hypothetical protein